MTSPIGTPDDDAYPRRWHLRIEDDGRLRATLAGSDPPIVASADSLAALRKQVVALMLRARRHA